MVYIKIPDLKRRGKNPCSLNLQKNYKIHIIFCSNFQEELEIEYNFSISKYFSFLAMILLIYANLRCQIKEEERDSFI